MTRVVLHNYMGRKPIVGKFRATAAVRDHGSNCSCGCDSCRGYDARGLNKATIAKEAVRQLNFIGEMLREENFNAGMAKYHSNSANNYMKAIKEGGEQIPDWVVRNGNFLKVQGWRW